MNPFVVMKQPFIRTEWTRNHPFIGFGSPFVVTIPPESGVTLIELMITVAIAALFLTLAVPSMHTFIQNARIKTQANDFIADLSFARTEAIKRAANVTLCKSDESTLATPSCETSGSNWGIGRIVFIDSNADGNYNSGEQLLRIREPLDGSNTLTVNSTAAGANPQNLVVYTASGGTTIGMADTATFRLCDARGAGFGRAISVGFRGKVTLTKPPAGC